MVNENSFHALQVDKWYKFVRIATSDAEVAELADALRSGRSGRTLMWVQIPPSALDPAFSRIFLMASFL